jgi:hypothetical protein
MKISVHAQVTAQRIGNYCISRFQTDEESVLQLDVPWIAEKVELGIAGATEELQSLVESHAAELNRRRSTDSAVRETLRECGAPDNHSIHSQIEWLAKRNVRRRRLLEQAVSELLDLHGNHSTAALSVCTGCRLIAEIREEATLH